MYSNVHGNIGAITFITTLSITDSIVISSLVTFFSHYALDLLGEKYYGSLKKTLIWEVPPFLLFLFIAYLSDVFWLAILGWVLGNLMDIIDKKMYLSILFPSKYNSTYYFHKWKPLIQFNLNLTKKVSIISSVLFLLFILIK